MDSNNRFTCIDIHIFILKKYVSKRDCFQIVVFHENRVVHSI